MVTLGLYKKQNNRFIDNKRIHIKACACHLPSSDSLRSFACKANQIRHPQQAPLPRDSQQWQRLLQPTNSPYRRHRQLMYQIQHRYMYLTLHRHKHDSACTIYKITTMETEFQASEIVSKTIPATNILQTNRTFATNIVTRTRFDDGSTIRKNYSTASKKKSHIYLICETVFEFASSVKRDVLTLPPNLHNEKSIKRIFVQSRFFYIKKMKQKKTHLGDRTLQYRFRGCVHIQITDLTMKVLEVAVMERE